MSVGAEIAVDLAMCAGILELLGALGIEGKRRLIIGLMVVIALGLLVQLGVAIPGLAPWVGTVLYHGELFLAAAGILGGTARLASTTGQAIALARGKGFVLARSSLAPWVEETSREYVAQKQKADQAECNCDQ